jgi:hypothetical protein
MRQAVTCREFVDFLDDYLGPRLTTSCVMLRSWRGTRPGRLRESRGPVRPLDEG